MKIEQTLFLHARLSDFIKLPDGEYGPGTEYVAYPFEHEQWGPIAAKQVVVFDIPDEFDPRPGMAEMLRKMKADLQAETSKKVAEFDFQISKLLALDAPT